MKQVMLLSIYLCLSLSALGQSAYAAKFTWDEIKRGFEQAKDLIEQSVPKEQSKPEPESNHQKSGQSNDQKSETNYDKDMVRDIQGMLDKMGYEIGAVDGLYGRGTRKAIEAFQRDRGLTIDGKANYKTASALKEAVEAGHKASKTTLAEQSASDSTSSEHSSKTQERAKSKKSSGPSLLSVLGVVPQVSCDQLNSWISRLENEFPKGRNDRSTYSGLAGKNKHLLFADQEFVPAFGESYLSMDVKKRTRLYRKSIKPCISRMAKKDPSSLIYRYRNVVGAPFSSNRTYKTVIKKLKTVDEARKWKSSKIQLLESNAIQYEEVAQIEQQAKSKLSVLWPSERKSLIEKVNKIRVQSAEITLEQRMSKAIAQAKDYESAVNLVNTFNSNQELFNLVSSETRNREMARYNDTLNNVLSELLKAEEQKLAALGAGMTGMSNSEQWYKAYKNNYTDIFSNDAVNNVMEEFYKQRSSIIKTASNDLKSLVNQETDQAGVDRVLQEHLGVWGDRQTPAGAEIVNLANERKQAFARAIAEKKRAEQLARDRTKYSDKEFTIKKNGAVPKDYPAPTAQEIQLAMMRELVSYERDATMQDGETVYVPVQMGLIHTAVFGNEVKKAGMFHRYQGVKVSSCVPANGKPGYVCQFEIYKHVYPDEGAKKLYQDKGKDIAQNNPINNLILGAAASFAGMDAKQVIEDSNKAMDKSMTVGDEICVLNDERLVLTENGWRSPTQRAYYQSIREYEAEQARHDDLNWRCNINYDMNVWSCGTRYFGVGPSPPRPEPYCS